MQIICLCHGAIIPHYQELYNLFSYLGIARVYLVAVISGFVAVHHLVRLGNDLVKIISDIIHGNPV